MGTTTIALGSFFLTLLAGIVWGVIQVVNKRLSRIDKELRSMAVMLSEIPNETSLKEYIFAQDQRLRGISEKLDIYPGTDILQQYIQDQANQVIAFLATHSEDGKSRITKKDLEITLQATNELIERVLWSMRFDEDKYAGRTETNKNTPEDQGKKNISKLNSQSEVHKDINGDVSMGAILESCDDGYEAMLKYMQQSGKSGVEAQQAFKAAKIMRGSS